MHGHAGVLFSSNGAHNADITWHTGPSVARKLRGLQPWLWNMGNARDIAIFLDSDILGLTVTGEALGPTYYRAFCTIYYGHPLARSTPDMT